VAKVVSRRISADSLVAWLNLNEKDMAAVPGISVKQAQKLAAQIQLARDKGFRHWLSALGFPTFALKFAEQRQNWGQLEQLTSGDWETKAGVGQKRARQVYGFIHHPQVMALAERLKQAELPAFQ
jgi:DNA ligase (NAD+)